MFLNKHRLYAITWLYIPYLRAVYGDCGWGGSLSGVVGTLPVQAGAHPRGIWRDSCLQSHTTTPGDRTTAHVSINCGRVVGLATHLNLIPDV